MIRQRHSACRAVLFLFTCLVPLGLASLPYLYGGVEAQTIRAPIPRHTVLTNARRYSSLQWTVGASNTGPKNWTYWVDCIQQWRTHTYVSDFRAGETVTGMAYKWGGGDYVDGYSAAGSNDSFLRRLANGHLAGDTNDNWTRCPNGTDDKPTCSLAAGVDCSGFVTRVWGRPANEKWGTWHIGNGSSAIPYDANRHAEQLPVRMRMGDVFNDSTGSSQHVVLLHYFRYLPNQSPQFVPVFYEASWDFNRVRSNDGGWQWLQDHGGWWNGQDGYRPYRYPQIRDDVYLPWLSTAWYNWDSVLFVRNSNSSPVEYVIQHAIYRNWGGDAGALGARTFVRATANDTWEIPTSILNPGANYLGGGVVAADAGTAAVVYAVGNRDRALGYSGIYPFSGLGMGSASTLYMPVFSYSPGGNGYLSKVFVQNAGPAATNVTAEYYSDDGRTCTRTVNNLAPWGVAILDATACPWGNAPTSGALRLTGSQPLAAISYQHINWERVSAYNAFSGGSRLLYAPFVLRNFYGWHSQLHVQNLGSSAASYIRARYYASNGAFVCQDVLASSGTPLSPFRHRAIAYGGSTCLAGYGYSMVSVRIEADQPIAAVVNSQQDADKEFISYNALPYARQELVLPLVRSGTGAGWVGKWSSDIIIQNGMTGGPTNHVYVDFYDQAGRLVLLSLIHI